MVNLVTHTTGRLSPHTIPLRSKANKNWSSVKSFFIVRFTAILLPSFRGVASYSAGRLGLVAHQLFSYFASPSRRSERVRPYSLSVNLVMAVSLEELDVIRGAFFPQEHNWRVNTMSSSLRLVVYLHGIST